MIKEWLEEYNPVNKTQAEQALREIMQEIALAGLYRTGFFEKAAFYGGTALRILYGLDRYSEDIDFSLLEVNPDFSLEQYLEGITTEFSAVGMQVSVKEKEKTKKNNIDSTFLKSETVWKELVLEGVIPQAGLNTKPAIKIKLEVDTQPPLGFRTEDKLLLKPFSFYVRSYVQPDLFAGKMHALLFRKWLTRVKGRDWYDMEWYIRKKIPLNLEHLRVRSIDSGDWQDEALSQEDFFSLLRSKIEDVSISAVREDVIRFIPDPKRLDIWSPGYFMDLVKQIRFE